MRFDEQRLKETLFRHDLQLQLFVFGLCGAAFPFQARNQGKRRRFSEYLARREFSGNWLVELKGFDMMSFQRVKEHGRDVLTVLERLEAKPANG